MATFQIQQGLYMNPKLAAFARKLSAYTGEKVEEKSEKEMKNPKRRK